MIESPGLPRRISSEVLKPKMKAHIRWLRTEWPTSTTMLEIPIYLLLSVMTGPRVTMMEYRAVTGAWPTSNSQAAFSDAMFKGNDTDLYRGNSVQWLREGLNAA